MIKPEIDFADPKFKADPYPVYARLRAEVPVCRVRWGRWVEGWLITRYDDVVAVLKDERFTKSPRKAKAAGARGREMWLYRMSAPLHRNIFATDQPDHTRLRALVQKAFTTSFVEGLRLRVESLTEELLDRVASRGRMDVIRDYALPLPITIIAEMLGVPLSDSGRFERWTAAVVDLGGSAKTLWAVTNGLVFLRYIKKLIHLRRMSPANDLISSLIVAEGAGDRLDQSELVNMVFVSLIAGYETTANLVGNGTLALVEHRAEMEKLRAWPALIETAVEELLRYDGPLALTSLR